MAAFHLKGFERFLALKQVGKAARTTTAEAKVQGRTSSSSVRSRSVSRRRK